MLTLTEDNRRYHAVLTFLRDELIYDIANCAYIEGHVLPDEAEHMRHMTIDITQQGNIDRVTRMINLYHAKVVELLHPWTKRRLHVSHRPHPWDDRLVEPGMYRIDLIVEADTARGALNLLEQLIHEYLVCHVLADWLRFTYPDKAAIWDARAQQAEDDIVTTMASQGSPTTRPPFPL